MESQLATKGQPAGEATGILVEPTQGVQVNLQQKRASTWKPFSIDQLRSESLGAFNKANEIRRQPSKHSTQEVSQARPSGRACDSQLRRRQQSSVHPSPHR
jgi:hypothetical protein